MNATATVAIALDINANSKNAETEFVRRLKKIDLNNKKKKCAIVSMVLALSGLILMILESEFYFHDLYSKVEESLV